MRQSTEKNFNLTPKQLKTIGYKSSSQIPTQYWNQKISDCFKKYDTQGQNSKYLANQTYKEFIDMDLSGANQEGSGRYEFNQISQIKFSLIQKKPIKKLHQSNPEFGSNNSLKKQQLKNKKMIKAPPSHQKYPPQQKPQKISDYHRQSRTTILQDITSTSEFKFCIKAISQIMTNYFQIPVSYDSSIHLSIDSTTNNLVDEKEMTQFILQQKGHPKISKGKLLPRPFYDVWKLIDIGIQYKALSKNSTHSSKKCKSKHSVHLFLIEADLLEDGEQIDGRATGDGVAFVSFSRQDFLPIGLKDEFFGQSFPSFTLPILIHECLHTLGFDHCSGWECLMNSVTNEQFLLCPGCVRKLESQINGKVQLKDWYEGLGKSLKRIKSQMRQMIGEQRCIRLFGRALCSKQEAMARKQREQIGSKSEAEFRRTNQRRIPGRKIKIMEFFRKVSLYPEEHLT